jgi:Cu/Ag efflux protein CusF
MKTAPMIALSAALSLTACATTSKAPAPAPAPVAAAPAPKPTKPSFDAARSNAVEATVKAVDQKTREVTLVGPDGEFKFVAGPEVKNLAQVKVGDVVTAAVIETLSLQVLAKGEVESTLAASVDGARAKAGEKPAGAVSAEVYGVANIDAVDRVAQKVTVTGPRGKTMVLDVKDPKNLENVVAGDKLEFLYTATVVVAVDPAAKK